MSAEVDLENRKATLEKVLEAREAQAEALKTKVENMLDQMPLEDMVENGKVIERILTIKTPLLRRRLVFIEKHLEEQQIQAYLRFRIELAKKQELVKSVSGFVERGRYSPSVLAAAKSQLFDFDLKGKADTKIAAGLRLLEAKEQAVPTKPEPIPTAPAAETTPIPEPEPAEPVIAKFIGKESGIDAYELTFPDQETFIVVGNVRKDILEVLIRAASDSEGQGIVYEEIAKRIGVSQSNIRGKVAALKNLLEEARFSWQITTGTVEEAGRTGKRGRRPVYISLEKLPGEPVSTTIPEPTPAPEPADPETETEEGVPAEGSIDFEPKPEMPLTEAEQKAICRALIGINGVTIRDIKGEERPFIMEGPGLDLCRNVRDEVAKNGQKVPAIPLSERLDVLVKLEQLIELTENESRANGTAEIYHSLIPQLQHLIDVYGIYAMEFGPCFKEMLLSPETRFSHEDWTLTEKASEDLSPQRSIKRRVFNTEYELPKIKTKVFEGEAEVVEEVLVPPDTIDSEVVEELIEEEERPEITGTDKENAVITLVTTPSQRLEKIGQKNKISPREEVTLILDEIESKGSLLANRQSSLRQVNDAFHTLKYKRIGQIIENGYIAPEYLSDHHPGLTRAEIALAVICDRYMKGNGGLSNPRVKMYRDLIDQEIRSRDEEL